MKNSKRNYYPFWRNNGAKKSVMPEGKVQLSMAQFENLGELVKNTIFVA